MNRRSILNEYTNSQLPFSVNNKDGRLYFSSILAL